MRNLVGLVDWTMTWMSTGFILGRYVFPALVEWRIGSQR